MRGLFGMALLLVMSGCATPPAKVASDAASKVPILARSTPADASTVAGPVDSLQLVFAKPVRLFELTVDGPDGSSPMMINAVGEVTSYSIPLPGLASGSYRVNWRASAASQTHNGTLTFTVRD